MAELIDKDFPINITERDRPIHERWLKDKWSIGYKNEYLKTDHWSIIVKEMAIWSEGKCALNSRHCKTPMHVHHRKYELWYEKYNDMSYLCRDCHQIHHEIWPSVNCRMENYYSKVILHEIKKSLFDLPEEEQRGFLMMWCHDYEIPFINDNTKLIEDLIKGCAYHQNSQDRERTRELLLNAAECLLSRRKVDKDYFNQGLSDREKLEKAQRGFQEIIEKINKSL